MQIDVNSKKVVRVILGLVIIAAIFLSAALDWSLHSQLKTREPQWSESFKNWANTHELHIDYTDQETGDWCAVRIVDVATKEAQCLK